MDGHLFLTDNGSLIVDVMLEDQDMDELAKVLDSIPGVVDHGIFLTECDELIVERATGIDRIVRAELQQ
jgi:ribose 5-phosphate isomerase